jgi:hypothetical protein
MSLIGQVQGWVDGALEAVRGGIEKVVSDLEKLEQRVQALEDYVSKIEQSDGVPDDPKPRAVTAPAARGSAGRRTPTKSTTAQAGTAEAHGVANP